MAGNTLTYTQSIHTWHTTYIMAVFSLAKAAFPKRVKSDPSIKITIPYRSTNKVKPIVTENSELNLDPKPIKKIVLINSTEYLRVFDFYLPMCWFILSFLSLPPSVPSSVTDSLPPFLSFFSFNLMVETEYSFLLFLHF